MSFNACNNDFLKPYFSVAIEVIFCDKYFFMAASSNFEMYKFLTNASRRFTIDPTSDSIQFIISFVSCSSARCETRILAISGI